MQIGILWPTFALAALSYAVFLVMFVQRGRHIKAHPPHPTDFDTGEAALRYFQPVEMPANNYRNLFEMPVLYFALVPLLLITRQADHIQVILAWVYVLLRVVHSAIHIGSDKVNPRTLIFAMSAFVLLCMWVLFFADMLYARPVLAAAR